MPSGNVVSLFLVHIRFAWLVDDVLEELCTFLREARLIANVRKLYLKRVSDWPRAAHYCFILYFSRNNKHCVDCA